MTFYEQYNNYIESVCKAMGAPDAAKPISKGFELLLESHRDRTTGGNYFGKTIRDQNNFDRKVRTSGQKNLYQGYEWDSPEQAIDHSGRHDIDPTQTNRLTNRLYGFNKPVSAGKGGDQYGLGNDGFGDTGDNTGMAATSRRSIKRLQNRLAEQDMQSQLNDMNITDPIDIPDNTYTAPNTDDVAAAEQFAPTPTTVADVAEVTQEREKASKLATLVSYLAGGRSIYDGMPTDGTGTTIGTESKPTYSLDPGEATSLLNKWDSFQPIIDDAIGKNCDPSLLGKIKALIIQFITFFKDLLAGWNMKTANI